jgi:hypothetical protein
VIDFSKMNPEFVRVVMFIGTERKGYWKHISKTETVRDDYGNMVEEQHEYDIFYRASDNAILTGLNEKQKRNGKPLIPAEFFELLCKVCERDIDGFPKANLPRKPEKTPDNNLFQSPTLSGARLERCPEWEGDELKPEERFQRNPYGAKEKRNAESYVKHLDHYGPVWLKVNGRLQFLADNLSKAVEYAGEKKYERFSIVQCDWFTEEVEEEYYVAGPSTTV